MTGSPAGGEEERGAGGEEEQGEPEQIAGAYAGRGEPGWLRLGAGGVASGCIPYVVGGGSGAATGARS